MAESDSEQLWSPEIPAGGEFSAYLERHRDLYIHRLQHLSRQDDWNGWIAFFLTALVEQAQRVLVCRCHPPNGWAIATVQIVPDGGGDLSL